MPTNEIVAKITLNGESFGWILKKNEFICDICTVQTYLGKWGEKQISAMMLPNSKKK